MSDSGIGVLVLIGLIAMFVAPAWLVEGTMWVFGIGFFLYALNSRTDSTPGGGRRR
jgi:hypothetical protein